ncbi:hypothetical protein HD806DRAFT_544268 [Xylariaceae sp. AK1471]|nr:hypothetical protein HD806DRAFT_544268 [Xylariaceae sp. AK1471]
MPISTKSYASYSFNFPGYTLRSETPKILTTEQEHHCFIIVKRLASSPTTYAELGSTKHVLYKNGVTDPDTYKLVDHLVDIATIAARSREAANVTG